MRAAAVRFAHQFPNSDSCSVDYVVIGLYILHNDLFVRTSDVAAKTPPSTTNVPEKTIKLAWATWNNFQPGFAYTIPDYSIHCTFFGR